MTISEKTAYLKGLPDGLGLDPASKEGKLWNALNDLLGDIAHELEDLRETDRGQAQAIDGMADELSYLEELCGGFDGGGAYAWLAAHAWEYGLVLRYPEGKETVTGHGFEPEHYRFVGTSAAKQIRELDLTLEEYVSMFYSK